MGPFFVANHILPGPVAFVAGLTSWQFWLILAALLMVAEVATVMLVSIWFVAGALAAALASVCGATPLVQILIFLAVSIICLCIGWHFRDRLLMQRHRTPTNADRLIGQPARVEESIDLIQNTGRVSLKGQSWRALSAVPEQQIPRGSIVTVVEIKGASLLVKPAADPREMSQADGSAGS